MPDRAQGRPCPHHDSFAGPASRLYGDCRVRDPMASITGPPGGPSSRRTGGDSPLRTAPNCPAACPAVFVALTSHDSGPIAIVGGPKIRKG